MKYEQSVKEAYEEMCEERGKPPSAFGLRFVAACYLKAVEENILLDMSHDEAKEYAELLKKIADYAWSISIKQFGSHYQNMMQERSELGITDWPSVPDLENYINSKNN